jgi:transcriptional regulator with XRE-family HTH domain
MTAEEFKQAQARLNLTNKAMAQLLCVSVSYVEMLRRGVRSPSHSLQRIIELEEKNRRFQCKVYGKTSE